MGYSVIVQYMYTMRHDQIAVTDIAITSDIHCVFVLAALKISPTNCLKYSINCQLQLPYCTTEH